MPRTIVFLRGEKDWKYTKEKLDILQNHEDKTLAITYGTVMEFYVEAFGNPDFIACLWSNNLELAKLSIIFLRKFCEATTTSIIGADPDEIDEIEKELCRGMDAFNDGDDRITSILQEYLKKEEKRLHALREKLL